MFLIALFPAVSAGQSILPERLELRYCYARDAIPRNADGSIKRSGWTVYKFRQVHACPVTGKFDGSCPGWQVDHVIPLSCGGCDSINNMQWLPVEVKTCDEVWCKDRFERTIYCK